jgi:site-specific DNA-cytosine methylase
MKILIGCEESGRVREAFRGVGHDAWSCDLLPCTENPSKYHIQDDLLKVIKSEKWDMIIAFPPCTHLAISGAKWFPEKIADGRQQAAIDFVQQIWDAECPRIAIENPVGVLSTKSKLGKASQYIQPYWFGERTRKKTGLWLKGLPKLVPTDMIDISKVSEKELNKLYYLAPSPTRALERSKTFHGVANAMASQWKEVV